MKTERPENIYSLQRVIKKKKKKEMKQHEKCWEETDFIDYYKECHKAVGSTN